MNQSETGLKKHPRTFPKIFSASCAILNLAKPEFPCFLSLFVTLTPHSCACCVCVLRFVCCFLSPFSLPPSRLLTFDLPDFETSVDSRCTTDSADSAFVCRRYWSPALLPFTTISLLQSSSSNPSHTGSKTRHLPRRIKHRFTYLLNWYICWFFIFCHLVHLDLFLSM